MLVVAGSTGRTGAARMAARAALRGGAGLVTLAGPASLNAILCQASDELMTLPLADDEGHVRFVADQIDAALAGRSSVVVGPGLGVHDGARAVVRHLVEAATVPLVIDADALTCVAGDLGMLASARRPPVLTPHPGEMARLIGTDVPTVQRDRIATARRCAAEHGCILVLKGSRTIVASPDGEAWINPTGNPGMATGGMGDVLAGLVGALIGQGLDAGEAARLAVYVHGDAADRIASRSGTIGMIAGDVIEELPPTLAALSAVLASGAGR